MIEREEIVIERGVPIPRKSRNRGVHKMFYPFARMEVGDCFTLPRNGNIQSLRTSAYVYGGRHSKVFAVHKTASGPRCWRIA